MDGGGRRNERHGGIVFKVVVVRRGQQGNHRGQGGTTAVGASPALTRRGKVRRAAGKIVLLPCHGRPAVVAQVTAPQSGGQGRWYVGVHAGLAMALVLKGENRLPPFIVKDAGRHKGVVGDRVDLDTPRRFLIAF